jgi:hypothetical protein
MLTPNWKLLWSHRCKLIGIAPKRLYYRVNQLPASDFHRVLRIHFCRNGRLFYRRQAGEIAAATQQECNARGVAGPFTLAAVPHIGGIDFPNKADASDAAVGVGLERVLV